MAERGPPAAETRRLRLRTPEPEDVEALFAIQNDPRPMLHTRVARERADTALFLARHAARYAEDGFAPWTALLRETGEIVGWGGLNRDPDAPHWGVEVAYFLHWNSWGRGLATELVEASLHLAFGGLRLAEVGAFTRPENHASRRVLEKTGFVRVGYVAELERDRYLIEAAAWTRRAEARS